MNFLLRIPTSDEVEAFQQEYRGLGIRIPSENAYFTIANEDAIAQLLQRWANPKSLIFVSEKNPADVGTRYLLPAEPHDLFQPVIRYSVITKSYGCPISKIIPECGILTHSKLEDLKFHVEPKPWAKHMWKRLFCGYWDVEDTFGYFASEGRGNGFTVRPRWNDFPTWELPLRLIKGKVKSPEFLEPLSVFLEFKWPLWEKEGTSHLARAAEVVEAGILEKLSETTFREICEREEFFSVQRRH